jgi:hypothetical protein
LTRREALTAAAAAAALRCAGLARNRPRRRRQGPPEAVGLALVLLEDPDAGVLRGRQDDGTDGDRPAGGARLGRRPRSRADLLDGYAGGGTIPTGSTSRANHDAIVKNFEEKIPRAAQMKVPNVITFFGNRREG